MRYELSHLRRRLDTFVWALLPGICILCNARSNVAADLCEACRISLPWIEHPCRRCALPLSESDREVCAACHARPPPFLRTIAALRYVEPVTRMIHRLKFNGSRIDARVIGGLLAERIHSAYRSGEMPDLIVPVPLNRARLLRRGHNQSALLARWVGPAIDIPIDFRSCQRIRHTPPQTGLRRTARLHNLADAFGVTRSFAGISVAVVDDVMTTGSTVTALTRTLIEAGADEVHIWAAARTPQPDSVTAVP